MAYGNDSGESRGNIAASRPSIYAEPFLVRLRRAKSAKNRIKGSLKRWHPDRFDNRCLVRVIDSEKERVKVASGIVARYLNELLRKENGA